MSVPLSPWVAEVFGKQALAIRVGLGQALRNMQANALAAHEQAESRTNHTYGSARWQGQFERLQEELQDLPGATPVKPYNFPFELMLIGKGLLYPFQYSKTASDVRTARIPSESQLVKELFTFAPAPAHTQGAFDFDDFIEGTMSAEPRGGLANVPSGTHLILVPFACNVSELLEAHWGIAALGEGRRLQWTTDPELIPLPATVTSPGQRLASVPSQPASPAAEHSRFDHGTEPALTLSSRADADRERDVTPLTEAEPVEDQAGEDDATH
ncbi:hypothetical protein [Streptomyces nanshensis]|uniref:Uncharacterized protein n=1 Tax=Streptomyces nanshensis TaxID=518642 RepID=A0A1E7LA86_9ACTN|nr:hypothetical protein [Streptomyces nanshensis]OEV13155.1 hypothetical protein AN218_04925 [Streptomyces nanshensis]